MNDAEINDLKIIKKKYGEAMFHFCREQFPAILSENGVLSDIMLEYFAPSRFLYEDLTENDELDGFKNFIFSKYLKDKKVNEQEILLTPEELLKQKGYILKECFTETEIQAYKKYYYPGEELCTFRGGRLDRCRVFFAVKENVADIRRENFKNPKRQDEYGTSVISIQFSRDASHILSIKNRYNHKVANPDATFSNDLDNIVAGLTESFEKYKNLKQTIKQGMFEIPGYTQANDGKYYKYNYEINGVYYCPNNTIIKHGMVHKLESEKYILMDYYILDLKEKKLVEPKSYGNFDEVDEEDSFKKELTFDTVVEKIEIKKNNENKEKEIKIKCNNDKLIIITLDKYNRIIGYSNNKMTEINWFLVYNTVLKRIDFPNVETIGDCALDQKELTNVTLQKVATIGENAFSHNKLTNVIIPESVTNIGRYAFYHNQLTDVVISEGVTSIGSYAFEHNQLTNLVIPESMTSIGGFAFRDNRLTNLVILRNTTRIGADAFRNNQLTNVVIPEEMTNINRRAFEDNVNFIVQNRKHR